MGTRTVRPRGFGSVMRLAGGILLVVTMLGAAVPAARADVNLTGSWNVEVSGFPPTLVAVTQTGTSLDFGGIPGTIDSATGASRPPGPTRAPVTSRRLPAPPHPTATP